MASRIRFRSIPASRAAAGLAGGVALGPALWTALLFYLGGLSLTLIILLLS